MSEDPVKVEIFLDDAPEPIGSYRPPASFELDTTKLRDGPHKLTVRAWDQAGVMGIRTVEFVVRNGPGIAVVGLKSGDIVEGKMPVLVNAYSGGSEKEWEPKRAETPAPVPTWAWVLFLLIVSWAMFYWADNLRPKEEFGVDLSTTPTFASSARIEEAAGVQPTAAAQAQVENRAARAGFEWAALGKKVFDENCVVCHQADGAGLPGFVAPLRGSARATAQNPEEMLLQILRGAPAKGSMSEMPAFGATLSDAEMAAVANLIRTSWGHNAPTVIPDDVRVARGKK
jgi:mono/diheme cytochrome c family protein